MFDREISIKNSRCIQNLTVTALLEVISLGCTPRECPMSCWVEVRLTELRFGCTKDLVTTEYLYHLPECNSLFRALVSFYMVYLLNVKAYVCIYICCIYRSNYSSYRDLIIPTIRLLWIRSIINCFLIYIFIIKTSNIFILLYC